MGICGIEVLVSRFVMRKYSRYKGQEMNVKSQADLEGHLYDLSPIHSKRHHHKCKGYNVTPKGQQEPKDHTEWRGDADFILMQEKSHQQT